MRSLHFPFARSLRVRWRRWDRSTRRAVHRKPVFERIFSVAVGGAMLQLMGPALFSITRDVLLGAPPWQIQAILIPLLVASWALYFRVRQVRNLNRRSLTG